MGRVFRALHTIKGSGAMFGFDELASFTHELENAFDDVRTGALTVTSELVDVTLAALDQIRTMLVSKAAMPMHALRFWQRAHTLRASAGKMPSAVGSSVTEPAPSIPREEEQWGIHFSPGPDMLRNGSDPLLLLKELAGLGEITIQASLAAVPPFSELETERCYVTWDIELRTASRRRRYS